MGSYEEQSIWKFSSAALLNSPLANSVGLAWGNLQVDGVHSEQLLYFSDALLNIEKLYMWFLSKSFLWVRYIPCLQTFLIWLLLWTFFQHSPTPPTHFFLSERGNLVQFSTICLSFWINPKNWMLDDTIVSYPNRMCTNK